MADQSTRSTGNEFPDESSKGLREAITVVIVTYNSATDIGSCVDGVVPMLVNAADHIIVFDNDSADHTAELVEQSWPRVEVIRSPSNVGFAQACNRATENLETPFVLLLNPDVIVEPGCIDELFNLVAKRPAAGIFGGRGFAVHGEAPTASCWGRPTLWSITSFATTLSTLFRNSARFNPEQIWPSQLGPASEVAIVSGCLMLIERSAWQSLGGFDERFFMYGEDSELCIRATRQGYAPVVTADARFRHSVGGSSTPVEKLCLLFKGKMTLLPLLFNGPSLRLAIALMTIGVWIRAKLVPIRRWNFRRNQVRRDAISPAPWPELWRQRDDWIHGWADHTATRAP
ncbi:MAG: glycosyltransferase family 2 protein [Actinomycetes bacterium]